MIGHTLTKCLSVSCPSLNTSLVRASKCDLVQNSTFLYLNFLSFQACGGVLDVGFIVDSSGSLADNFETIKIFVKKFIDGFDVAKNKTHVSLMTFSNEAKVQFSLSDEYDAEVLKQFVDRAPHDGGETYIDKALKAADSSVFTVEEGWRRNVTSVSTHEQSPLSLLSWYTYAQESCALNTFANYCFAVQGCGVIRLRKIYFMILINAQPQVSHDQK